MVAGSCCSATHEEYYNGSLVACPTPQIHKNDIRSRYTCWNGNWSLLIIKATSINEGGQAMTDSTKSMRKIVGWPSEVGLSASTMPQFPLSPEMTATWTQSLRKGVSERRKTLQTSRREQQKENLQSRDRKICRDRMDRPGERESKRLLCQTMEKTSVPLRMSKVASKRHPDKIDGRMSKGKWEIGLLGCWAYNWFLNLVGYGTISEMPIKQYSNTGWLKETSQ